MTKQGPLWQCPKCGHRFVSNNLWHSCGHYRLADHFRNRSPVVRLLFNRWRAMARTCGPVTVYAQKTRIVFQAGVRFAGAVGHKDWLEATIWLSRRAGHRCVHRIESFGAQSYGIHFRLETPSDLDSDLEGLLREAYREHATARIRNKARAPNHPLHPTGAGCNARAGG